MTLLRVVLNPSHDRIVIEFNSDSTTWKELIVCNVLEAYKLGVILKGLTESRLFTLSPTVVCKVIEHKTGREL